MTARTIGEGPAIGQAAPGTFLIMISPLGPHPPNGPGPTAPYALGPTWDDRLRPECECEPDDRECGDGGAGCACPAASPR
jgi:hypothetical protein